MQINWTLKTFPELSLDELYTLLRLRNEVFIVEQNCPFPDLDGKDQLCHHLLGLSEDSSSLVAYTRVVPPGVIYDFASIGRVATALTVRRYGVGRELMRRSITAVEDLYGPVPIQIGAQRYLQKFYESFGFRQLGDMYLEDGIEHILMLRDV
ncbi:GNAT family N-acetyltransferase [Persicitalea jodogahamensis]|nr:GNAT family N-acetyltransferase [Persicitalea jodogahamensis]